MKTLLTLTLVILTAVQLNAQKQWESAHRDNKKMVYLENDEEYRVHVSRVADVIEVYLSHKDMLFSPSIKEVVVSYSNGKIGTRKAFVENGNIVILQASICDAQRYRLIDDFLNDKNISFHVKGHEIIFFNDYKHTLSLALMLGDDCFHY